MSLVTRSLLDVPVSLAGSRTRVGASGGVVSVGLSVAKSHEVAARALPARSSMDAPRLTV